MTGRKFLAITISILILVQGAAGAVLAGQLLCACSASPSSWSHTDVRISVDYKNGRTGEGYGSCCRSRNISTEKSPGAGCCETTRQRVPIKKSPCKFCGTNQCQCRYSDRSGRLDLVFTLGGQDNLDINSLLPLHPRDKEPLSLIRGPDPVRILFRGHGPPLFICKSSLLI